MPFYVLSYGHFFASEHYFTKREEADSYLFIYTVSGKGLFKANGREFALTAGDAILINCWEEHFYGTFSGSNWELRWTHFKGDSIPEYHKLIYANGIKAINLSQSKVLTDFIRFEQNEKHDELFDVQASSFVSSLLTALYTNSTDEQEESSKQRTDIQKVLDFIAENYAKPLTTQIITSHACLSRYHFMRLFKQHVGISLYEYLLRYRTEKAAQLLKNTDLTVKEVSAAVGFTDVSHFIRLFKRYFGNTPAKHR